MKAHIGYVGWATEYPAAQPTCVLVLGLEKELAMQSIGDVWPATGVKSLIPQSSYVLGVKQSSIYKK